MHFLVEQILDGWKLYLLICNCGADLLSSPLTLQMFIACRGIPVLVGFLEPDYAKYRSIRSSIILNILFGLPTLTSFQRLL